MSIRARGLPMIEGWVSAIETMPELSAATAALTRRAPDGRIC
jgi:hypothetical protein